MVIRSRTLISWSKRFHLFGPPPQKNRSWLCITNFYSARHFIHEILFVCVYFLVLCLSHWPFMSCQSTKQIIRGKEISSVWYQNFTCMSEIIHLHIRVKNTLLMTEKPVFQTEQNREEPEPGFAPWGRRGRGDAKWK